MATQTIVTSVIAGGSNNHATVSAEANAVATDFVNAGVVGTITSTSGIAPSTGAFACNQDASPDMGITLTAGSAYIAATPASQSAQVLRAYMSANQTSYVINANATGGTRYDWIYLAVNATNAANPSSAGDNVTAITTSRSTSNVSDNGSPPTFGILLAVVTVANGASSITNANIADKRTQATLAAPAALSTYQSENTFDHVASGCVWSGDSYASTLNGSMTAGVVYIGGVRVAVAVVTAHAFAASKDTYIYVDNTGVVTYSAQTNNAASPALPSNSILLGIIISGAGNIAAATSVNQGQETMVLPIASSIAYAVTDSLGNLICPRDPTRRVLGFRQIISSPGTFTTIAQVTGLSVPVIIPTGRKIKVTFYANGVQNSGTSYSCVSVWDGVVGSGTLLSKGWSYGTTATEPHMTMASVTTTPTATTKTYNAGIDNNGSGTVSFSSLASTSPSYIMVELV